MHLVSKENKSSIHQLSLRSLVVPGSCFRSSQPNSFQLTEHRTECFITVPPSLEQQEVLWICFFAWRKKTQLFNQEVALTNWNRYHTSICSQDGGNSCSSSPCTQLLRVKGGRPASVGSKLSKLPTKEEKPVPLPEFSPSHQSCVKHFAVVKWCQHQVRAARVPAASLPRRRGSSFIHPS